MSNLKNNSNYFLKIDNFIHKHLHNTLLVFKIFLITITILYFIVVIVVNILEKNKKDNPKYEKIKNILTLCNNILFYVIIIFVILLSIILMFITRSSSLFILKKTKEDFKNNFFYKTNKKSRKNPRINKNISIPKEQLIYYMSLNWWMLLYLLVITIFVTIAKIKHDPKLIYNLF